MGGARRLKWQKSWRGERRLKSQKWWRLGKRWEVTYLDQVEVGEKVKWLKR